MLSVKASEAADTIFKVFGMIQSTMLRRRRSNLKATQQLKGNKFHIVILNSYLSHCAS